eukprot:COSAG02_NODE_25241_length_664_cov_97.271298_2_plen_37_part_01
MTAETKCDKVVLISFPWTNYMYIDLYVAELCLLRTFG